MMTLKKILKHPLFIFIILFTNSIYASNPIVDFEDFSQDYVVEIKKIEISGHPHAFNPSIVRWQGSLLMCFREIPTWCPTNPDGPNSASFTQIGLIWLDDDFNPIGEPHMLTPVMPGITSLFWSRSDDARLVTIGECLYIVNSDNKDRVVTEGGFRMFYAQIDYDGDNFLVHNGDRLTRFEGENAKRREKNWVPFDYNGNMLLAYSLSPHKVLQPFFGYGECETVANTQGAFNWNWGDLRGGTPALKINDHQYLAFFHSCEKMLSYYSQEKPILHYFMGAYTFSAVPPFEIEQISLEPIIAKGFYSGETYKPYWKPVRVVFPCGFVFDEQFIWLSYGRQDHEMWIAKIDKQKLLDSLATVVEK